MTGIPRLLSLAPALASALAIAAAVSAAAQHAPELPPWQGAYKIRPEETARLTEADIVGPDGIVYPDWTHAGVPGGIPDVADTIRAEDYGAKPDDDGDDAASLQRAIDAVAARGGGALVIGPGTFHLDRTLQVTADHIVIRGAGRDRTRLIFRYRGGPTETERVCFFAPAADAIVDRNTWIEIHAWYKDLDRLTLRAGGQVLRDKPRAPHWGATFALGVSGQEAVRRLSDGRHVLTGIAEYRDGSRHEARLDVVIDTKGARPQPKPQAQAAILFRGMGRTGRRFLLAQDGARGSREIVLASAHDLRPGDRIFLSAPPTERWKRLTRNACPWGAYRDYYFVVAGVEGRGLRLNQPMRLEYPVIDGAYVQRWVPLRNCGVEGFHLEHVVPHWISGVEFHSTSESWARDLRVDRPGRHAVMFTGSKWCEIRDCEFRDAWHPLQGGGSAYVGWQHDCDCLMDNCQARRMRHGPCVQWAAVGNVIRNSSFSLSDGQWHAGWSAENLFENCAIDAERGTGSYGYAFWGSPPGDAAHGPEGPRNVVYHCDTRSPRGAFWMGGMNENWILVYNRCRAGAGPAVFAGPGGFDHIIRGNVFVLHDPSQPAVFLAGENCVGVEIADNVILGGNGILAGGKARPLVDRNNVFRPLADAPRPTPVVPSIFEWQRKRGGR